MDDTTNPESEARNVLHGAGSSELPSALTRRPLGRTGIEPTVLSLGTWGLADDAYRPSLPGALPTLVDAAIAEGIRSFDVAPLWGDGEAERVVGAAIADRRDEFTVVTRVGAIRKGHSVVRMFDPAALEGSIELSRKRLGVDQIDAVLLHDPPEKVLGHGAFAKALASIASRGLIRAWGLSTTSVEAAQVAMSFGAKVLCVPHNLLMPDVLPAIVEDADNFGVGVIVRSPLAHGLLTASGVSRTSFDPDDHRSRRWTESALATRQKHATGFSAAWTLKTPSLTSFALRFALTSPSVATAAVGPRTVEQLKELVNAVHDQTRLDAALVEKTSQIAAVLGV